VFVDLLGEHLSSREKVKQARSDWEYLWQATRCLEQSQRSWRRWVSIVVGERKKERCVSMLAIRPDCPIWTYTWFCSVLITVCRNPGHKWSVHTQTVSYCYSLISCLLCLILGAFESSFMCAYYAHLKYEIWILIHFYRKVLPNPHFPPAAAWLEGWQGGEGRLLKWNGLNL